MTPAAPPASHRLTPSKPRRVLLHLFIAIARGGILVAVVATFLCSLALLWVGATETWVYLRTLVRGGGLSHTKAFLGAIEVVDLFLLATVVQVVSLGLYQLYFDDRLPVPPWLRVTSVDDLKANLVNVTITLLGVSFLAEAVSGPADEGLLFLGVAVAAVVAALSYFTSVRHGPPKDRG